MSKFYLNPSFLGCSWILRPFVQLYGCNISSQKSIQETGDSGWRLIGISSLSSPFMKEWMGWFHCIHLSDLLWVTQCWGDFCGLLELFSVCMSLEELGTIKARKGFRTAFCDCRSPFRSACRYISSRLGTLWIPRLEFEFEAVIPWFPIPMNQMRSQWTLSDSSHQSWHDITGFLGSHGFSNHGVGENVACPGGIEIFMPHLRFSALTSCLLQLGHRFEASVEAYLPTMKSSTLNSWICFWGASLGCQACIACWAIGQWSYCSLGRCPNGFIKWWVVGPIRASNLEGSALKLSFPVLPWLIPMTLLWCFYSRNLLHQKHLTHLYKNLHLLQLAILWISPHFILTLCPSKQSHAHRSYGGIYSKSDPVCITVKYHISPTLNLNNVVLGGILCLNSLSSLKKGFFEVVTV